MRSEVRRRSAVPASGASAGSPQTRTEPEVQLRLLIMKRWWAWPLLSLPPRTLAVGNTPTPSRKAGISGSWHLLRSLLAPSLGPAGTSHPLCHGSASARMFMSVRRRHLSRRWRNVGPSSSESESESESSIEFAHGVGRRSCQANVNCKTHLFWAAHLQNVPVQNVECKPCCKRFAVLAFSPNVLHTRSILFVCKITNVNSGLSEIIVSRGIHLDQSPGPVSLHRDADREKKLGGVRRTIKVAPTLRYRHPTTLLRVAA